MQEMLARMRHIPGFIGIGIAQAEVGGQVHDLCSGFQQVRSHFHGLAVGDGKKDDVAVLRSRSRVEFADDHIRTGKFFEEGIKITEAAARFRAGAGHGKTHTGMRCQQPRQFHARVASDAYEAYVDAAFFHAVLSFYARVPKLNYFCAQQSLLPQRITYFMRSSYRMLSRS